MNELRSKRNMELAKKYACKFLAEHNNITDLSNNKLKKTFINCVIPAKESLYPLIREEIEKLKNLKDLK